MSCYRPIGAYRTDAGVAFYRTSADGKPVKPDLWLPCGMCIGCRAKRASDWATRCMHEASLREHNCFVTLTYGPGNLPAGASLSHRDYQLFMKRLRKHFGYTVRYFMCGEYGEKFLRPHYHACLFGVDFRSTRQACGKSASGYMFYESPVLTALWTHGRAVVQDLTRETSGYCARYVMKKLMGPAARTDEARRAREWTDAEGEVHERAAEYAAMSLKPGIGSEWFDRYGSDVYKAHDTIILPGGRKERPPKFYDLRLKRSNLDRFEDIKESREKLSRAAHADNTDERLRVREQVFAAKMSGHLRELE